VTAAHDDHPMVALLTGELYWLLTRGRLIEGVNLLLTRQDDRLVIQVMAVSTGTLGVLLASLSDPAELDDPGSLTCRITPGEAQGEPGAWEYELVATRYPVDHGVVFLAKIRLPVADLPEVVSRLRRDRLPPGGCAGAGGRRCSRSRMRTKSGWRAWWSISGAVTDRRACGRR
jgi:hypothetical protein